MLSFILLSDAILADETDVDIYQTVTTELWDEGDRKKGGVEKSFGLSIKGITTYLLHTAHERRQFPRF